MSGFKKSPFLWLGLGLVALSFTIYKTSDLALRSSDLVEFTGKDGVQYQFKKVSVEPYKDGSLREGLLVGDVEVTVGENTFTFQSGTTLAFFQSGAVQSATLSGHHKIVVGENHFQPLHGTYIYFYESGLVWEMGREATSEEPTFATSPISKVGAATYTFDRHGNILFHNNGVVREATLGEKHHILLDGKVQTIPKWKSVEFDRSGKPVEVSY